MTVDDNDVTPRRGALAGGAMALVIVAVYLAFSFTAPIDIIDRVSVAFLPVMGAALGWFIARSVDFGVGTHLVVRYQQWVLPGESLLIVQAPADRIRAVLALLRQLEGGQPATFVVRAGADAQLSRRDRREMLRRERFTTERLKLLATRLAASHTLLPRAGRLHPLWDRLRENDRTIESIHSSLAEAAQLDQSVSLATEWLLDNAYIIRRHIGDVQRNLPKRFYDVLPLLESGPGGGEPRVHQLAVELLAHTDIEVHEQDLIEYLLAYQSSAPLTMGELWAMPLMLRLALINSLALVAVQIAYRQHEHETADLWANRLLNAARRDPDQLLYVLTELAREQPGPSPYFADRLASQLQGEAAAIDLTRGWLERKLGAPLSEVIEQEQRRQAADQVTVANAISSLRQLSLLDWRDIFERVSPVDRVLQEDPTGIYAHMDFATRDHYRHAIEEIARRSKTPEVHVAQAAVNLAKATVTTLEAAVENGVRRFGLSDGTGVGPGVGTGESHPMARRAHVGYFLIDAGRVALEARVPYRPPLPQRLRRWALRHPARVYIGSIVLISLALLIGTMALAVGAGGIVAAPEYPAGLIFMGALALFSISEVAVQLVNYLATQLLLPRPLPKLHFEQGIPDEWRTLVVVPMLMHTPETIQEDVERLEIRFLANQDTNLHFALLADFEDALEPEMPEDHALLQAAMQGIEQLNTRYAGRVRHDQELGSRFSLFYRQREWSASEQCWMGWERKRGKLEDLNRLLTSEMSSDARRGAPADMPAMRNGHGSTDMDHLSSRLGALQHVGEVARLEGIRFVITLDADTQLPHDAARRMVETLAHPLNRPYLAADGLTVEDGYTIIQPRVSTSLPSAVATRFSRFFTDPTGTDPYTQAVSDVYQDLAGEGSYHGKGIYDLRMFHRVLGGRFPDALLLSHDLLEGAHVRVGLASDIELFDLFPSNYLAYAGREHRWIRGDWQIVDWCTRRVPSLNGRRPNALSAINKWKILDNARRSLTPAATVLLLVAGWLLTPPSAALWSAVAGAMFFLSSLLQLGTWICRQPGTAFMGWRDGSAWLGWRETGAGWIRALLTVALLPHQAAVALDAVTRVWFRRNVSRRRLLEWQTAQMAHAGARARERHLLWQMGAVSLLSVAVAGAMTRLNLGAAPVAAPFLALWFLSPGIVKWLNTTRQRRLAQSLSVADRILLRKVARQTWRFFDDFVGPATNWLPPDNYQSALRVEVAQRTSPTNIGLWLLSTVAAQDFGYLTLDQVIDRGRATVDTLHRLERFEGHLLNWYHTATLEPLPPRYVSTVDSGNLLGSLWALNQSYALLLDRPLVGPEALRGLEDTLALVQEWPATELPVGVEPGRIYRLIATLRVLFVNPPDDLAEIVRRLRAAAGPARELAAAMRAGTATTATVPATSRSATVPAVPGASEVNQEGHRLRRSGEAQLEHGAYWASQVEQQVAAWIDVVERYLPWVEILAGQPEAPWRQSLGEPARLWRSQVLVAAPSLRALAAGEHAPLSNLVDACARLAGAVAPAAMSARLDELVHAEGRARWLAGEMLAYAERLIGQVEDLSREMNMRFLYDTERRLFTIGYNVSDRRIDPSYYDLLASEARLGSFVAIARGDIPVEHWVTLGRSFGLAGGHRVLLSWSGTMFEYLMPLLLTRSYENSLLDEACRATVARQIEYGARQRIPWGISEAAFSAVDPHQIYQYQAFGVPGLGLKRGLEEDLVVAPYATTLALLVEPRAAVRNLRQLARLGLRSSYGYYEAIDFTPRRQAEGGNGVIVYTYMAHHQGMALLAILNALHDNVMQARFHADSRVRATEPLLFERIPVAPPLVEGSAHGDAPLRLPTAVTAQTASRFNSPNAPSPRTQLLSNGTYAVMLTSAGGGYSRWRDINITRWQADTTLDALGSFLYVRDLDRESVWSAAHQPVRRAAPGYQVTFAIDRVQFERRDGDIGTTTEIVVSPEDDAEIRRVTLINRSNRRRRLEVTSYLELALATHSADRAHPAFSKLFVQTEALPERGALLAHRLPRSTHEPVVWAAHVAALPAALGAAVDASQGNRGDLGDHGGQSRPYVRYETDRARFIGRGRSTENPAALDGAPAAPPSNVAAPVLDPIFSLRCAVSLEPGQRMQLSFVTVAAETRQAALALVEKYSDLRATDRAFELAWTKAQLEPRHLRITMEEIQRYQQLASHLLFPDVRLRAAESQLRRNRLGQSRLWAYGVSGDLPIMVVTISDLRDLDLVREALMAHAYWRIRGFKADLVILNEEAGSYEQPLQDSLRKLSLAHAQYTAIDQSGGIFLRSADQMPGEDLTLLLATARVVLVASRGSLVQQLSALAAATVKLPPALLVSRRVEEEPSPPLPFMELPYFNGLGGFTPDGKEYAIYLGPGAQTPAPWVNVMANPDFGALVSEAGSGFAWSGNSQANRLLPWSNDPVCDPVGDAIYIRDETSGVLWTPTPQPIRELDPYRARHGQGYTLFEHNSHAIEQELVTFVPIGQISPPGQTGQMAETGGAPVRVQRLRLRNRSSRRRRLAVTFYAEWVLGTTHEETQMHVVTGWDAESGALLARNHYHPDFSSRVAFASASPAAASYTADRTEFLGRNGSPARPAALARRTLSGRSGAGLDPCAALQVIVEMEPGQHAEVTFLLGQAADAAQVRRLVQRYGEPEQVEQALQATRAWWDRVLETVQVETPDLAANFLLNRWLPYQTLSCRFWARSAFYQSGGAYGFRDQLQDSLALVYASPQLARQHILEAAAHQFTAGDVQHWWHPPSGAGVRTRISDDLLWLPYVTAHYVRVTGDTQILDEVVAFLDGRPLEKDEHDAYFVPSPSAESASLLEHCRRAIARGATAGPHGLPLIGTGDWNDGLNLVGAGGKGESVWLAWFLIDVLNGFAALLEPRGEASQAAEYRRKAVQLASVVEAHAWDGAWYHRAYFDDGTPLGSKDNLEARIDSLPQSWGVISGAAHPARAGRALQSVEEHLIREQAGLILLFTPPFHDSPQDPGYIKGYPPGVRENGGQYTHAAIWTAQAFARCGDGDRAATLLRMLNPVEHAREPEQVDRYKVEPYVVAADVYALEGHVGQGGWTWYTGSSSWLYRVWLEEVLGFKLSGDRILFDPVLPSSWDRVTLRYRHRSAQYYITLENPERINRGVVWIDVDGERLSQPSISLRDDGAHHTVVVRLGAAGHAPAPRASTDAIPPTTSAASSPAPNGAGVARAEPAPRATAG